MPPRDPAQLARWWRRWPQANIGLVTGELADVLDVDGPAGRAALLRFATDHDLRLDGQLVRTGTGWHYYLAPSGGGNRAGLLDQVDWRGHGGYVVAPSSRHANGRQYRWLRPPHREAPTGSCSSAPPARNHTSPTTTASSFSTVPPDS